MQEIISQVLIMLRGAWKYRWAAVAAAWLIAIAGWIGVQMIPDVYESRTEVYVDTDSLLKPLLSGLAVNRDVMSQVAMVQAVMLARPNLEKVALKTDFMLAASTPSEQEVVLNTLASRIKLGRRSGSAGDNTFVISFESDDPKSAHAVVRTLLDTFMEDSLGMKRSDSGVAQRFLQAQIKEYEAKLTEAERRLAAFKQQNVGLMPGSDGDYYQRLESEMAALQLLRQRMTQLSQRRNELFRQLQGEEPTYGLMGSTDGSPIDGQIAKLKSQLDQLLLQYTDKHPQVQSLKESIGRLQDEKRKGAKISQSVAPPGADTTGDQALVRSLDMNPVYQNLRLALSQADADLAEIRGQISGQQGAVADLRSRVNTIPEVEAELSRLDRDYAVNRQQYDTLLQRLESAKISEQAEQSSENVKFRVIQPPTLPAAPSGPVRLLLDAAVLVAALGGGVVLAGMLALLHPTFSTRDMLQRIGGVPVLGSITAASSEGSVPWYRRQSILAGGALGLLLAVFVLNVLMSEPLRAVFRKISG